MSDDQGEAARPATAAGNDTAVLQDLQKTVGELARSMGAGLREDLAQIRAIAASVAERDVTDDVRALREEVAALAARLDGLASAEQVGRIAGDLRAQIFDALGGLDGERLGAELESLRSRLGTGSGTLVEELQEHLADVASGEVVGELWDEVRGVRAEVEGIGAAVATVTEPTADPAVAGMRDDVQALVDEVRALSDAIATLERDVTLPTAPAPEPQPEWSADEADPLLAQVADELSLLRSELAAGLVVEPSDALSTSLDALRDEVDELRRSLSAPAPAPAPATAESATLDPAAVTELREEIRAAGGVSDQVLDALREELKALRRRLAVKASERVLDDDQLAQIADAVAARLARG